MKALILNSGRGSRMGDLTKTSPKCMTKLLGDETILSRQLNQLLGHNITDIVITTGAHAEVLTDYVKNLALPLNIQFVHNPKFAETNYIYSIYLAREFLADDIILMHGDLVFSPAALERVLAAKNSVMTVSRDLPLPDKDFKAVLKADMQIEKIGIEFFERAVAAQPLYKILKGDWLGWLGEIEKFIAAKNDNCYAENAFNQVSDTVKIYGEDIGQILCSEIDTPEDLEKIKELLKNER